MVKARDRCVVWDGSCPTVYPRWLSSKMSANEYDIEPHKED